MKNLHIITGVLLCVLSSAPSYSFPFWRHRLDPISESSTDNVECFLDYMELWVPRRQMDGLLLWLSRVMKFPVSLSSLDRSNHLISRCRYALDMDSNGNFFFRVHYSACNVQTQHGFHVLEIHMVKKTSAGNGRSDRYIMRCPAVTAAMGREIVRCDPYYVQVSRPMPLENTNNRDWFLLFRNKLVVSVEDASLIGVEVEMNKSHVTVKGLRNQLLTSTEFFDRPMDVLPLWFGHGFYAYSLEASCPLAMQNPGEEVIVHLPKQRMGLVKRGSYISDTMTLRNIVVGRPINITVTENKHFVMVNIPAADILQSQECTTRDNRRGHQVFYSIDLVLEFTEVAYPMNWTLENYYDCTGVSGLSPGTIQQETFSKNDKNLESFVNKTINGTNKEEENAIESNGEYQLSTDPIPTRFITPSTVTSNKTNVAPVKSSGTFIEGSGEHLDISGSGDHQEFISDQINATQMTDLANMSPKSSNSSMKLASSMYLEAKYPNILNVLTTTPPHPKDPRISYHHLSNFSVIGHPKNTGSSKMLSTFTNESENKTSSMNISEHVQTSAQTMLHVVVTEHGHYVNYSAEAEKENFTKTLHSQKVSDSKIPWEKKPKYDADLWDILIGDTLQELLHETISDGLISPVHRHTPSRRGQAVSLERTKKGRGPDAQGKTMDKTSIPSLSHQDRTARDPQHPTSGELHMTDDSMLSSHHMEESILDSLQESMRSPSDLETIASAEQLIVEK